MEIFTIFVFLEQKKSFMQMENIFGMEKKITRQSFTVKSTKIFLFHNQKKKKFVKIQTLSIYMKYQAFDIFNFNPF